MSKIVRVERVPDEESESEPVPANFPSIVDIAAMLDGTVPVKIVMIVERSDGAVAQYANGGDALSHIGLLEVAKSLIMVGDVEDDD